MRFGLVFAGVTLFVGFLVSQAPAWVLTQRAQKLSGDSVQLSDAAGSLWNGSANLKLRHPQAGVLDAGRLNWKLAFWPLLRGRLGARLEASGGELALRGDVNAGWSGSLEARDFELKLPAVVLGKVLPALRMLKPGGQVEASGKRLNWQAPKLQGEALITWRGFTMQLSKIAPLGDYQANAQAKGDALTFQVKSLAGPLRVEGSGSWSVATKLNFSGVAQAEGPQAEALATMLRLLGPDQGGGRYKIELKNF